MAAIHPNPFKVITRFWKVSEISLGDANDPNYHIMADARGFQSDLTITLDKLATFALFGTNGCLN